MSDPLQILVGVLGANMLTGMFLWGCWRASKIMDDRQLDRSTFLALIVPLAFLGLGFAAFNADLGQSAEPTAQQAVAEAVE